MASILVEVLKYTQDLNLSGYYNGETRVHGGEENLERQLSPATS